MVMSTKRISATHLKSNQAYQLLKFLFTGKYKVLSNNAKILYSIIKDHQQNTIEHPLIDDDGFIYIEIPQDAMMDLLNVSYNTFRKAMNELITIGLIEEDRIGLQLLNRIYLIGDVEV